MTPPHARPALANRSATARKHTACSSLRLGELLPPALGCRTTGHGGLTIPEITRPLVAREHREPSVVEIRVKRAKSY
eukprot:COSAG06_NODE_99_length_24156_cov_20.889549_21_plen_77_part_00